ncbi:FxSxx-COOH system tetratricopeptide repeat protein [Streptomyces uncialis]|uniref:FxSxx-COOH system tetratricopeptide repeat protein n=1 Tax=Streptomyces uncialis TaxID=1048205 RepID=UPI0034024DA4
MTAQEDRESRSRVTLFCSAAENIGQTTTLLNVALVLAESGRRVLIVEVQGTGVRASRYLGALTDRPPRDTGAPDIPGTGVRRPSVWDLRAHGRGLQLSTLAVADVRTLTSLFGRDPGLTPGHPYFERYDEILVDAPAPRGPRERAALAPLPHVLVTCFTLSSWLIEGAAALARDLRGRATDRIGVLAVGLKADSRANDQLRTSRALIRDCFEDLSDGPGAHYVELPYDPQYTESDVLAVGEEPPGTQEGLRPRFVRLAAELARSRPARLSEVTLLHTPRHIAWAEWIEAQLESSGVRVNRSGFDRFTGEAPGRGAMLLALSPIGVTPEQADALAALSHPDIRMVLVDAEPLPRGLSHHEQIVLRRLTEPEALRALRRGLHLPFAGELPGAVRRFPRLPPYTNLRPRNLAFIGRDPLFERLRGALATAAVARTRCVLMGPPGIGKSQTAMEYCHRFSGDYDIVWWVRADSAGAVRRGLTRLAERLGLPTVGDVPATVLAHLRAREHGSWLLVYDDVRDPALLADPRLAPGNADGGHVLVTTWPTEGPHGGHLVEVPPFSREESRALLTTAVRGLSTKDAGDVSAAVGHVPLMVRLAAAWLEDAATRVMALNRSRAAAVKEAAGQFNVEFTAEQDRLLQEHRSVPLARVMLEVALASLRRSPGAEAWSQERGDSSVMVWLLECCALLTESGASLPLLRSQQMRAAIARHTTDRDGPADHTRLSSLVSDAHMVDVALWTMARYGLVEVDFARPDRPVRQHQVLRDTVLERMGATRATREIELRAAIAEYSFGGPPGRPTAEASDQLARQLTALRFWEDDQPEVRQRLIEHLLTLARTRDELRLREVLELGASAEAHWRTSGSSAELLRLHQVMAAALRLLGRYAEASRHARTALRGYRAAFGPHHPRTLLSIDAYGAILRADGHFADALAQGRSVVQNLGEILGPEHLLTGQVEHNLAVSELLTGNAAQALDRLQDQLGRRRAIGGPDDERAWGVVITLASAHRVLGQNRESFDLLKEYLAGPGGASATFSERAVTETGLAVSERRLGNPRGARERDGRVLADCLRFLGPTSPVTLRSRFSLAGDLHALGEHEAAAEQSAQCVELLRTLVGTDHPFTQLGQMQLATHHRSAGRPEQALAGALAAHEELNARLGPTHPWTLSALSCLGNVHIALNDPDEAVRLEELALDGYDEIGLGEHPDRALVAANLMDSLARTGQGTPGGGGAPRGDIDLEMSDV